MIKKCIVCNENFNAKVHNQYYCSDKCKKQDLTRICKECGKEFQVPKKSSKTLCCSKSCSTKLFNKEKLLGKASKKNKNKNVIDVKCNYCKREYKQTVSEYNRKNKENKKHYCSKECYKKELESKYEQKYCKHCKKAMPLNYHSSVSTFCSKKCAIEYRKEQSTIKSKCKCCGKEIIRMKSKVKDSNNIFCSKECSLRYRILKESNNDINYSRFRDLIERTKEYKTWTNNIANKYKNKCAICNSEKDLAIHHIIHLKSIVEKYNYELDKILKSNEFNNINNGILLCKYHHDMCHDIFSRSNEESLE